MIKVNSGGGGARSGVFITFKTDIGKSEIFRQIVRFVIPQPLFVNIR